MAAAADKQIIYRKINEYIKRLKENDIGVWRLYLYGSYAKGTQHPESDIDLAVFLDKENIDGIKDDVELMRLRWDIDLNIEPHAFARTDFDETDPFVNEIITTGERIL
ncbi:MAG: nucleotidyltransferase domain-containing protein [Deltaproteobacteria bacterium]|nr:nucleotidyltransferase domain-containing protein [Deltaproteobacteria bacterium]